jgi:hypothetical protein
MRKAAIAALLAILALSPARAEMRTIVEGLPPVDWDQDTLSLPPAYFPEMPEQLCAWLEVREYRIPQVHDMLLDEFQSHSKYNMLPGNLDGVDGQDWIFITFKNDTSKAYICWNSDTSKIEQLEISEFDRYPGGYNKKSKESEKYPIGYKGFGISGKQYLSFEIISSLVRSEWLNEDILSNIRNIYGDSTSLPKYFSHDGIIFATCRDRWNGGFIRYFYNGKWLRFWHSVAEARATLDTLLLNNLQLPN